jgi:hypothetical protein
VNAKPRLNMLAAPSFSEWLAISVASKSIFEPRRRVGQARHALTLAGVRGAQALQAAGIVRGWEPPV